MTPFPPHDRFLLEVVVRALQMAASGIKKYIELRDAAAAQEQNKEIQQ